MRILLLAPQPFFQSRGTPIAVRGLVETLGSAGHRLDVLTYPEGEEVRIPGATVHRLPALPGTSGVRPGFSWKKLLNDVLLLGRSASFLREGRHQVVHAVEESVFLALAFRRLYGIPYVYDMDSSLAQQMTERYAALGPFSRMLEAVERRALRAATGIIAVCRALEDRARDAAPGTLLARIEDASLLPEAPVADAGGERLDLPRPVVMYVGNLEPYQGVDLLLDGWARACAQGAPGTLAIIGGEPDHTSRAAARAEAAGVGPRVRLLGPRPVERLGHYLAQADLLVSPRIRGTNTPMKVYSYLDSGIPVIATRLPTHTQVLDDRVAVLVAPEPEAMARGILGAIADPEGARRLAERARRRMRREYSPGVLRARLLDFYGQVERAVDRRRRAA